MIKVSYREILQNVVFFGRFDKICLFQIDIYHSFYRVLLEEY